MIKRFIESNEPKVQRALEIFPGAAVWAIILFPVWGSFLIPEIVAYFIIGFNVYWLYRSLQLMILGLRGYGQIKRSESCDWRAVYNRVKPSDALNWEDIYHLVIIPNAGESVEKISSNLDALAAQTVDKSKLLVVLAMEARVKTSPQIASSLLEKYKGVFGDIFATFHPDNLQGEIVGKAANMSWAAKKAKGKLVSEGFDLKGVTLTSCDADARFHPKYFEALTYEFACDSARYRRFWQSPIFWYNNIWRVPAFIRIVGVLGNVMHIADLQEPIRLLFNYSCYSTSFKMIDDLSNGKVRKIIKTNLTNYFFF